MADIAVENYKKNVERATKSFGDKMDDIGKKLAPLLEEYNKLVANKTPSADEKKRLTDIAKQIEDCHKAMDKAALEMKVDLMLLDPPKNADPKELKKLPDWLSDIIKKKGLPLGKGVSVAPDIDFDFKAMKFKKAGVTFTIDLK